MKPRVLSRLVMTMQKLVACQVQKVRKPQPSTASVVEGADRLELDWNALTNSFNTSTAGEFLLMFAQNVMFLEYTQRPEHLTMMP